MSLKIDPLSFASGYVAGVATALLARRLRPVLVELLAVAFAGLEGVAYAAHVEKERFEDIVAEARHRARERAAETRPRGEV